MKTRTDLVFLCRSCTSEPDLRWRRDPLGIDGLCSRCHALASDVYAREADQPRRGLGPVTFSTSVALDVRSRFIWDVNRYYADLGVSVRATRTEIRDAYLERGGPDDQRLTYVTKQLLDNETRSQYDAVPLGGVFVDRYVREALTRRILDSCSEALDDVVAPVDDGLHVGSGWSHYEWQCSSPVYPAQWRTLIIEAFKRRKDVRTISVGWMGRSQAEPFQVVYDGEVPVFFLREGQDPTSDISESAVTLFLPFTPPA